MADFEPIPDGYIETAHIEIRIVESIDGEQFRVQAKFGASVEQAIYMLENIKHKLLSTTEIN